DKDIRPAFGLAELDLYPPERDRRAGCAETVRERGAGAVRLGAGIAGGEGGDRLLRADPEQRRPGRPPGAAECARTVAAAMSRVVAGNGTHGVSWRGHLSTHRHYSRRERVGELRPRRSARIPLGHLSRGSG